MQYFNSWKPILQTSDKLCPKQTHDIEPEVLKFGQWQKAKLRIAIILWIHWSKPLSDAHITLKNIIAAFFIRGI